MHSICKKCKNKVDRADSKIKCGDCSDFFHANCANILDSDIEFMEKNCKIYRCAPCASLRRKSLHFDSLPAVSASVAPADPVPAGSAGGSSSSAPPSEYQQSVSLQLIYKEILELKKFNVEVLSVIHELQLEKKVMQKKIDVLQNRVNFLEQKQRDNIVEIVGLPDVNKTNAVGKALKLFSDGLNENITEEHIDSFYIKKIKSKKPNVSSVDGDIVCVKFISHNIKQKLLKKKREYNKRLTSKLFGNNCSNTRIYINESLSFHTRELLKAAEIAKKTKNYKYLWFTNSELLMRKKDGDKVIRISSKEDIDNL